MFRTWLLASLRSGSTVFVFSSFYGSASSAKRTSLVLSSSSSTIVSASRYRPINDRVRFPATIRNAKFLRAILTDVSLRENTCSRYYFLPSRSSSFGNKRNVRSHLRGRAGGSAEWKIARVRTRFSRSSAHFLVRSAQTDGARSDKTQEFTMLVTFVIHRLMGITHFVVDIP